MKWQNSLEASHWLPRLIHALVAISIITGVIILAGVWWVLFKVEEALLPLLHLSPQSSESIQQPLADAWWDMLIVEGVSVGALLALTWFIWRIMQGQVKALEESRARNRAIVDNMVDGVVHIDSGCNIVATNEAGETIFGYRLEELHGQRVSILFSSPYQEEWDRDIDKLLEQSAALDVGHAREVIGLRKDSSMFPMHLAISRVDVGGINMYTAIVRDMTDHHNAMTALERARDAAQAADRAKSQFLANMSHEIRTPMNGVMGMLDLLKETQLTTDQREFADTAQRSGQALLNIINDILDFSKIEAGKLTMESIDFDLRDDVEEVTALLAKSAHSKGMEVASYIAPQVPPTVRGDPYRLRQILINLMSNAVKFTDSGEVIVDVDIEQETEEQLQLRFQVSDTGIGIDKKARQRLFQPFSQADGSTTRKYGGTGLGLAICKRLVELMGGKIGVNARSAGGSCFWFTIDFKKSLHRRPGASTNLRGMRALVVDDNHTNRTILEKYLSNWGVSVRGAEDGYQALDLLHEQKNQGAPYDLAILDLQMPFMDGIELAQRIKSDPLLAPIHLVMLSSHGHPGQEANSAGIEVGLVKPVRQALLRDTLVGVLRKPEDRTDAVLPTTQTKTDKPRFSGRVLLVEDNLVNQRVLQKMLEKLGIVSIVAPNGAEAVATVKQQSFDLILMDVQMPVMDGLKATQLIRQHQIDGIRVPIMAMTANAMKGDQEKCIAVGMDDYLAKPINKKALEEKLARWLPLHPAGE